MTTKSLERSVGNDRGDQRHEYQAITIWTFIVTSVAVFMVSLDNLVVTTALPVIKHDLGASLQGLEWTVNAYTLTFAVLLLTGAALGDRFGRKRMFLAGLRSSRSARPPPRWRRASTG